MSATAGGESCVGFIPSKIEGYCSVDCFVLSMMEVNFRTSRCNFLGFFSFSLSHVSCLVLYTHTIIYLVLFFAIKNITYQFVF